MSSKRIVIIGGGFAGVTLAQRLEKIAPADAEVVLLSSENHFVFTPLLAEAAAREISPLHVVVPGRQMVRRTQWLTAEVNQVDRNTNQVHYTSRGGVRGTLQYDQLVIACGSVVDFDSIPGLAAHAYPLRTLGDAVYLSNDLIGRLEEAAVQTDREERERLLTIVVIGGGFSGVEIAGALNDLLDRTRRFYPQLREIEPKIILLQRGVRILPELNADSLSAYALRKLRAHGVDVRLNVGAREVTTDEIILTSGERLLARTVISTVGNASHPILKALQLPLERGRLRTQPDMRVEGSENIWALGDSAMVPNAFDRKPSPPTAQFATRQAEQLAKNLDSTLRGKATRPFSFKPLGMMASIGRHNAVAEVFGIRVSGFLAWLLWRSAYLGKMPTLIRKVEVALDWARGILFPPNVVQLQLTRTLKVGRAHFSAGEYVFRKGDAAKSFYMIERGSAGVYIDESRAAVLNAGDHFGEVAGNNATQAVSVKVETALDVTLLGSNDLRRLTDRLTSVKRDIQRSMVAQRGFASFQHLAEKEPELAQRRVSEWMSRPAETLSPDMTLEQTVNQFHKGRAGYPVTDGASKLVGYCGRTQLYDAIRSLIPADARLSQFLLQDPPVVTEDQRLSDVLAQLAQTYVEVLPVLAADGSRRVVGVLSPIEVFRGRIFTAELTTTN